MVPNSFIQDNTFKSSLWEVRIRMMCVDSKSMEPYYEIYMNIEYSFATFLFLMIIIR